MKKVWIFAIIGLFLGAIALCFLCPASADDTDIVWADIDPNAFDGLDLISWEETYDYEFDANSDPLIIGKMFVYYIKTGDFSVITLSIPLKDKSEYDKIFYGTKNNGRNSK